MFGRLLNYLQRNSRRVKIRERNGRRSFSVAEVRSVSAAVDILKEILELDSI